MLPGTTASGFWGGRQSEKGLNSAEISGSDRRMVKLENKKRKTYEEVTRHMLARLRCDEDPPPPNAVCCSSCLTIATQMLCRCFSWNWKKGINGSLHSTPHPPQGKGSLCVCCYVRRIFALREVAAQVVGLESPILLCICRSSVRACQISTRITGI